MPRDSSTEQGVLEASGYNRSIEMRKDGKNMTRNKKETPSVATAEYCGNCRFFKSLEAGQGVCRRHPPMSELIDGEVMSFTPLVNPGGWCGEHQFPYSS
jgi:hypothetical protein